MLHLLAYLMGGQRKYERRTLLSQLFDFYLCTGGRTRRHTCCSGLSPPQQQFISVSRTDLNSSQMAVLKVCTAGTRRLIRLS